MTDKHSKGSDTTPEAGADAQRRRSGPLVILTNAFRSAVADTLPGALTPSKPEPWLNMDHEWEQCQLRQELEQANAREGGLADWIIDLFGEAVLAQRGTPLRREELSSLRLLIHTARVATEVAGTLIERAVLNFRNVGEYQRFCESWRGPGVMNSRGMRVPLVGNSLLITCGPMNDAEEQDAQAGIVGLLVDSGRNCAEHEILHDIDPSEQFRKGYHHLLREAFAYYHACIVEPKGRTAGPDALWHRYVESIVSSEGDGEKLAEDMPPEKRLSRDEFRELCCVTAAAIRALAERVGNLQTQRILVTCETLQQLFRRAEVPEPAILAKL
jgi:hypothetical protein